jgi:hypothetical protein
MSSFEDKPSFDARSRVDTKLVERRGRMSGFIVFKRLYI